MTAPRRARSATAAAIPSRARMLEATAALLQEKGYHGTGLAEILARSGAPRGSMYFHFPEGKEQLACEALRAAGGRWKERFEALLAVVAEPADIADAVCAAVGEELEASGWKLGCPVATVALEASADSERLREACAEHYDEWERLVGAYLGRHGAPPELAAEVATVAVALIEGALLLARVQRRREPLARAARALRAYLATVPGAV